VYAKVEAEFGETNIINGDVGVTDANGNAKFDKNSVLDPYIVKAKNITVTLPATVNNRFYVPATGGPTPTFLPYTCTAPSGSQTVNSNTTLTGNWGTVLVKTNRIVTLTGNNFGSVTIEAGAQVTFTSSSICLEQLTLNNGSATQLTVLKFNQHTTMSVKNSVTIGKNCRVNVNGPRLTFYVGTSPATSTTFNVEAENTQITANVMLPMGKMELSGGATGSAKVCIMTGWYIVEEMDGDAKNVIWNKWGCTAYPIAPPTLVEETPEEVKVKDTVVVKEVPVIVTEQPKAVVKDEFNVRVYPNPTATDFNIMVFSNSNEPVTVRILDMSGVVRDVVSQVSKTNNIKIGGRLIGGTYMAEVIQVKNRQVLKLIKLN
jgi:hypothetical protein